MFQQYILPWLYGPSQQEKQLEAIEKSVQELKTSMAETIKSLQESQTELLSKLVSKHDKILHYCIFVLFQPSTVMGIGSNFVIYQSELSDVPMSNS